LILKLTHIEILQTSLTSSQCGYCWWQ